MAITAKQLGFSKENEDYPTFYLRIANQPEPTIRPVKSRMWSKWMDETGTLVGTSVVEHFYEVKSTVIPRIRLYYAWGIWWIRYVGISITTDVESAPHCWEII